MFSSNQRILDLQLLGLNPSSTEEEIKKGYRKMALKWHPDKNPKNKKEAEEKFKDITLAYNRLTGKEDSECNLSNLAQEFGDIFGVGVGGGFGDLLGKMFGDMMNPKGENIMTSVYVTLEECFKGTTRTITLNRKTINKNDICNVCTGTGRIKVTAGLGGFGPIVIETAQTCPQCRGAGYKENVQSRDVSIIIPPGSGNKNQLVIPGMGHERGNSHPGDLIVTLIEESHKIFKRGVEEGELISQINITLEEALLGFSRDIVCIDEEELTFEYSKIVKPSSTLRIDNRGMLKKDGSRGNVKIKFNIKFPKTIQDPKKVKECKLF